MRAKEVAPKRFALYIRCSTEDQRTDLQVNELTEYARLRGWSFVIYEDKASGTTSSRKMLQKLLADCRARRIDGVAVWKLDRLFRSLRQAVTTLSLLTELNVEFYSHKDQIDLSTPTGRLLANLLNSFAEFEVDILRMRVRSGLQAARARGVRLGRPTVITPDLRAEILKLRFEKKYSIRKIKRLLHGEVGKTTIERVIREHPRPKNIDLPSTRKTLQNSEGHSDAE